MTKFIGPAVCVVLFVLGLIFLPNKKPGAHYTRFGVRIGSPGWYICLIAALALFIAVALPIIRGK
jgi:choline-glycine betaine transporter